MYLDRYSTWPTRPGMTYRRVSNRSRIAHAYTMEEIEESRRTDGIEPAFRTKSTCGVGLQPTHCQPVEGETLICVPCYRAVLAMPEGETHA
ncbi:MAG: hypothetical protein V3S68_05500 [Dehalococcoidia bacterium]